MGYEIHRKVTLAFSILALGGAIAAGCGAEPIDESGAAADESTVTEDYGLAVPNCHCPAKPAGLLPRSCGAANGDYKVTSSNCGAVTKCGEGRCHYECKDIQGNWVKIDSDTPCSSGDQTVDGPVEQPPAGGGVPAE